MIESNVKPTTNSSSRDRVSNPIDSFAGEMRVRVEKHEYIGARHRRPSVELGSSPGSTLDDEGAQGSGGRYRPVMASSVTNDNFVGGGEQFREQTLNGVLLVERRHDGRDGDGRQTGGMLA